MKKKLVRLAAAAGVAGLVATMAPLSSAFAASTPTYDTTTDAPIYMMDNTTAAGIDAGTQLDWNYGNGIVLTANPVPADLGDLSWANFDTPAGATSVISFISAPGAERTPSAWKQWGDFGSASGGVLLPSVWPSYLGNGAPATTKANGGTYSMGIAMVDGTAVASTHVVKAYYTTINVDAGTGTWTFATPAPAVVVTDVPTTTTVSATPTSVEAGQTTTLTAEVAAAGKTVTGNVEFYEGTTKIGTVALSSGSASKVVTVGTTGAHTYSATFVENTVGSDKFLASDSTEVTVTGTAPSVPVPPNAATEDALNANSANGATVTYDEATHKATLNVDAVNEGKTVNVIAYSTPTYLGQQVVTGGKVTVDVSTLAAGTHKLSIADPSTGDVLAWAEFIKADAAISPSFSKTIDADVAALAPSDGEFSLVNTSGSSSVHLANPVIVGGQSVVSGELGTFKVTDMRQVSKPGWTLKTDVAKFVKGSDEIASSALGIAPKAVSQNGTGATTPTLGAAQTSGSASYPWSFATLAGGAFSGVSTYNADLVFTAPAGKPAGTYSSTITLTLVSN